MTMQVLTDEDLNECLPIGIAPHQTIVGSAEVIRLARAVESAVLAKMADRLRDAERYRWLKEYYSPETNGRYMTDVDRGFLGADLDAAIDAAMKKAPE